MEAAMHTHNWRVWRNMALLLVCAVLLTACGAFRSAPDSGPAPESARKAVKTAYTQMGKKYRPGGASPQKGFDCSGLIWWAYRENGVKVPRITTDQANAGQKIPLSDARQGDILVFRTGSGPRGLHTGIYAGGHLSTARGAVKMYAWKALKFHTGATSLLPCAEWCTDSQYRHCAMAQQLLKAVTALPVPPFLFADLLLNFVWSISKRITSESLCC